MTMRPVFKIHEIYDMKKLLLLALAVASLLTVSSCTKRVEGILREQPDEISREEAVKLIHYYDEQLATAESLLNENKTPDLAKFFKSPEWAKAEACHSKLILLPPELATDLHINQLELHFIEFVNKVIDAGIPLREVEE